MKSISLIIRVIISMFLFFRGLIYDNDNFEAHIVFL